MTKFIKEYMSRVKPNEKRTLLLEIDEVPSFDEWEVFEWEVLGYDASHITDGYNLDWYKDVIIKDSIIVYTIIKDEEIILLDWYSNISEYKQDNEGKTLPRYTYSYLKEKYLSKDKIDDLSEMMQVQAETIKEMEEELKGKDVIIAFLYGMLEHKIKSK